MRKSKEIIHIDSHLFRQSAISLIPVLLKSGHSKALPCRGRLEVPPTLCGNLLLNTQMSKLFGGSIRGGLITTNQVDDTHTHSLTLSLSLFLSATPLTPLAAVEAPRRQAEETLLRENGALRQTGDAE